MFIKRLFDIIVSALAIVVFSPVFVLVAILIVITGGFPIIYKQQRVGKNCKMFTMYKLRTMTNRASENDIADLGDSSRITKFGAFLRKTKLDEIPQLWNVLKGDMSIVGPRPELKSRLQYHSSHWDKVYSVRPGITGNSSIVFRNEEQLLATVDDPQLYYIDVLLPKKIAMYEEYVDKQSMYYDFVIIIKTVMVVLGKKYDKV